MSWYVNSTHLETLHDGRMVGVGDEVDGVDPELDKELIDRGALSFVRSEDEPEPAAATDAALILIKEYELDISDIAGTGKDGRVTEPDVRKMLEDATADEDNPSSSQDQGEPAEAVAPEPAAAPQKEDSK